MNESRRAAESTKGRERKYDRIKGRRWPEVGRKDGIGGNGQSKEGRRNKLEKRLTGDGWGLIEKEGKSSES